MDPTTVLPALAFGGSGLLGVVIYLLRQNWLLTKENGQIRKEVNEQSTLRINQLEEELRNMRSGPRRDRSHRAPSQGGRADDN